MCDIFMKEVQPSSDKRNNLEIQERPLFLTCELLIFVIGVTVTTLNLIRPIVLRNILVN
jgi:hypothetical protein